MKQEEWLHIGFEKGIISDENLISSDNKDMKTNFENEKKTSSRNIIHRKDGRYMCYAKLSTGRKAVYGATPEKAEEKAVTLEEKDRLESEQTAKYSFGAYYKKWFITRMNTTIKPQSLDRIECTYLKYYNSDFSKLDIRSLDEITIINSVTDWINQSEKQFITRKEFCKIMQIVKDVYATYYDECILNGSTVPKGIAWDTVKRKIEEQAVIHSPKKKEIALSESERRHMEEKALDEKKVSSLVWILVNYTGLRLGEITALTWQDVDLEAEVLTINKTMCKYFIRDKQGNRIKRIYDVGMSTRDIADVLGHSDIKTTEQCYIISTELEKKRKKMTAVL